MQRKGSYFYVIDAFIASIIIISAIVIIFTRHTDQPSSTQAFYTAEDFLSTIETTQLNDLYSNPTIRNWEANGTINMSAKYTKRTLLQQLALFEVTGNGGNATGTLSTILAVNTPQNIGIEIIVNGNQRFIRQSIVNQTAADTLLTAKRIVLLRQNATDQYNPVIVEVRTWQ